MCTRRDVIQNLHTNLLYIQHDTETVQRLLVATVRVRRRPLRSRACSARQQCTVTTYHCVASSEFERIPVRLAVEAGEILA